MADVVLFHSILGLRQAEREIAAALEGDGHCVIVPDLYDGARTDDYDEGFRLHDKIGEDALVERARAALAEASEEAVLAGCLSVPFSSAVSGHNVSGCRVRCCYPALPPG